MLNSLLVLGRVPGTNFQITFGELIIFCSGAILWLYASRRHQLQSQSQFLPVILFSSLNDQATSKPAARLTLHKALILQLDTWLVWLVRQMPRVRLNG